MSKSVDSPVVSVSDRAPTDKLIVAGVMTEGAIRKAALVEWTQLPAQVVRKRANCLVDEGHLSSWSDPTDARRRVYAPPECDGPTPDAQ